MTIVQKQNLESRDCSSLCCFMTCQKSTKKATCDFYLVDVVVALSVGEGFEVFKVFVGQVDADVVGVIVSRKEGGRRHCGVRQRRRISLSYPVLVPTE